MKVYIGSAYGRDLPADHVNSIFRLCHYPGVMWRPEFNDALMCRVRAKAMTRFLLDSDADVFLSIDDDIVFAADKALEICEQAMTHDIVAGQYVTRSRERCFPTTCQEDGIPVRYGDDNYEPVPVRWPATGFLAVHRRVFEKLIKRPDVVLCHPTEAWSFYAPIWTPFIVDGPNGPIYLSEDYAFAERAKQEGFQAYLNPSVRLLHLGQYPFKLEDQTFPPPPPQSMTMTRLSNGKYRIETAEIEEVVAAH